VHGRSSPCAQQAGFAERSFQKIVLQRQLPDLRVQRLHVDGRLRRSVATARTENIGSPALELRLPGCDLIGVDVELLGKLSQRSIALDGAKRDLRLTWGGSGQGGRIRVASEDLQQLLGIRGLSPIA
jgi:hypothetical protein